jgi:hypothetical protein
MILRPVRPVSTLRTADDEAAGRVDQELGLVGHHPRRQALLDDVLDAELLDLFVRDVGRVLRRDHDVGDADRLAVLVHDRHLRLRVGPQPRAPPALRILVSWRPRRCANMIGAGISSGVSLLA